ncbi:MAG: hypothetical protein KL787_04255 [Taibaiella sp.]|nr:hypothetical protein [Taibaiella sp.]
MCFYKQATTFFLFAALFFIIPECTGQVSVWNMGSSPGKHKDRFSLKDWRNKIRQWGMEDSFRHQLSVSAGFNTNGWTGGACYILNRNNKKRLFRLSVTEVMHEKETKVMQENTARYEIGTRTPFVFGKIHNLYLVQLGYGSELPLLPSLFEGTTHLGLMYSAGLSLCIAKPYYIHYIEDIGSDPYIVQIRYEAATSEQFLTRPNILGSAPWHKGLWESAIAPGIFADAALTIEPGRKSGLVKRMLLGVNFNYSVKPRAILAEHEGRSFFPYCYIGIELGKRW